MPSLRSRLDRAAAQATPAPVLPWFVDPHPADPALVVFTVNGERMVAARDPLRAAFEAAGRRPLTWQDGPL